MVFRSIFTEFMELNYLPITKINRIGKDIKVSDFIICRKTNTLISFYYLLNGTSIEIPEPWGDMFTSFNTYLGDRAGFLKIDMDKVNDVDKVIFLLTKIFIYLDRDLNNIPEQEFLGLLGELLSMEKEIDSFRKWISETFKVGLGYIEFNSVEHFIKL